MADESNAKLSNACANAFTIYTNQRRRSIKNEPDETVENKRARNCGAVHFHRVCVQRAHRSNATRLLEAKVSFACRRRVRQPRRSALFDTA